LVTMSKKARLSRSLACRGREAQGPFLLKRELGGERRGVYHREGLTVKGAQRRGTSRKFFEVGGGEGRGGSAESSCPKGGRRKRPFSKRSKKRRKPFTPKKESY